MITQFSLVPHLIGPPMQPWLHSSHWSPISLVPQCDHDYTVLIGPPSHWSPSLTPSTLFSLVPHLSLVPQCNPGYTALIGPPSHWSPFVTFPTLCIGPPSHWSPNVTLVIQFSLVSHLIGPPMWPWLCSSHWSPISTVPRCSPDYTVLIGPTFDWSPDVTLIKQFSLFPHLIGPPK